jgi:hypothetical protein
VTRSRRYPVPTAAGTTMPTIPVLIPPVTPSSGPLTCSGSGCGTYGIRKELVRLLVARRVEVGLGGQMVQLWN